MDERPFSISFAGRGVASLVALALLIACDRKKPAPSDGADSSPSTVRAPWPAFPTNTEDATRLIERETRRPATTRIGRELQPGPILEHANGIVAGWPAIDAWIAARVRGSDASGRSSYVLWGARHDKPGPIDAFRRLIGPGSSIAWTRVAVEQFHADGRWLGVDASVQKGDDALLAAYLKDPSKNAFDAITAAHERDDYAAWKLGYLDAVMDLLVAARSANRKLVGCDMPTKLQQRVDSSERWTSLLRLREIHCARAIADGIADEPRPHHVAVIWGERHLEREGFLRFLPADVDIVPVRVASEAIGFEIVDPVLVPPRADDDDALVVLPSVNAIGHVDRIRTTDAPARIDGNMIVSGAKGTSIRLDDRPIATGPEARAVEVKIGDHLVVVATGKTRIMTALRIPEKGTVRIDARTSEPEVTITYHEAAR